MMELNENDQSVSRFRELVVVPAEPMVLKKMKLRLTIGVEHAHFQVLNFSDVKYKNLQPY